MTTQEENNFRSERTCKGLRYQKFLAEQNIGISTGQQSKRRRTVGGHGYVIKTVILKYYKISNFVIYFMILRNIILRNTYFIVLDMMNVQMKEEILFLQMLVRKQIR